MFPILETDRLILRQITDQDAEAIFACFSNDEVTRKSRGRAGTKITFEGLSFIETLKNQMI